MQLLVWVVKLQEALVLLGVGGETLWPLLFEGQTWALKGEQWRVPHLKTVRVNASNARVVAPLDCTDDLGDSFDTYVE